MTRIAILQAAQHRMSANVSALSCWSRAANASSRPFTPALDRSLASVAIDDPGFRLSSMAMAMASVEYSARLIQMPCGSRTMTPPLDHGVGAVGREGGRRVPIYIPPRS